MKRELGPRPAHLLVAALASALLLGLASGCVTEASVESAIEDAGYCETAAECVVVYPGCPLGCWAAVNEAEVDEIEDLIERFHAQQVGAECLYDCAAHKPPTCEGGRCVLVADDA